MWVLSAPFDGEQGKVDFQKSKLLKSNKSYVLGRKGQPLIIRHPRVSRDHCVFTVGSFSVDNVEIPLARSKLEIFNQNKKDKKMSIYRKDSTGTGEVSVKIESSGKYELQHGDRIALVSEVNIMVTWHPLCAYSTVARSKGAISAEACAALGINLVHKPQMGITHYLTSQYAPTLLNAAALLTLACLVKPEWLQEIIRLGDAAAESTDADEATRTYLEDHFRLPTESAYRPTFALALTPAQKRFTVWEPNETRLNMFKGCRFVCVREKATEADVALVDAIVQGEGAYEVVDVQMGVARFRLALGKGRRKEGTSRMAVVAEAEAMQAAVGGEGWREFVDEAKSFDVEIIPPAKVIQAVLDADVDIVFSSASNGALTSAGAGASLGTSSSLPDVIPNSIPDEPSQATDESLFSLKPRKLPIRRVTRSASQSQEPSAAPTPSEEDLLKDLMAVRPRRLLTRRVVDPPFITGLDDPSMVIDAPPDLAPRPSRAVTPSLEYDFTTPAAPRSKLKRRVGVAADAEPGSLFPMPMSAIAETPVDEPPLKKFKALFDASNPPETGSIDWDNVRVGGEEDDDYSSMGGAGMSGSLSQTQTQSGMESQRGMRRGLGGAPVTESTLAVLREEEEEDITQSQVRGQKRSADEMSDDEGMGDAKRRAVAGGVPPVGAPPALVDKPSSPTQLKGKGKQGAPVGQPDTDSAFLKAIASTKRGKKTEDEFDREFNKLKIARPELDTRDPEEEWKVLAEFGDDSGLRGNFMTVVEMDVYKRDGQGQPVREVRWEWDGKPNFKMFKKKVNGAQRAHVELFSSGKDYGMGPEYWKGAKSQAHSQNSMWAIKAAQESQSQSRSQVDDEWDIRTSQPREKEPPRGASLFDSDEENIKPPPPAQRRAASKVPASKKAPLRAKAPPKKKVKSTLFLASDDDDDFGFGSGGGAGAGGGESDGNVRQTRAESMTLRSEGEDNDGESPVKVKRPARRKAAPVILAEDSDDGFTGFRAKKGKSKK